ncbi:MAG TPA: polysaccharide deacetylase family protein [Terracidiphilus sp.]|nr:polysaccharide deacetylase family protein [Terracidiphilus sp.]
MAGAVPQLSHEARLYALGELCRRAGLRDDDRTSRWRAKFDASARELRLQGPPPLSGQVVFPSFDAELSPELAVRKPWARPAPEALRDVVPDFIVPCARLASNSAEPLFVEGAPGTFRCTEDILASTVLLLSRYEEIGAASRDPHGRFRGADSMAARDGYLERPVVDEYGLALQQIMQMLDPAFEPSPRALRVKVSHDIDDVGIPFSLREAAVQFFGRRKFAAGLRNLSSFAGTMPGSLQLVMDVCELCAEHGLRSTLYWKASPSGPHDSGYDIADPRIAGVMDWARARGIEMGVHPGYDTYLAPERLRGEVELCRAALGETRIGGRQHYLRWNPETWAYWESCGLAYDSSVGYADRVGFRAGTCWPYLPWLWKENRPADLLELPLIVMDRTLVIKEYMGKSPEESLSLFNDLKRRCAAVGGVMTLLWHNTCIGHPWSAYLSGILDSLAGLENYDWESDVASMNQRSSAVPVEP